MCAVKQWPLNTFGPPPSGPGYLVFKLSHLSYHLSYLWSSVQHHHYRHLHHLRSTKRAFGFWGSALFYCVPPSVFLLYTRPLYSSTCGTRFPIVVNFLSTPKKHRKKPDWSRRGGGSVMVWLLFYVILSEIYERAVNLYPPYLSLSSTYTGYPALYHYRWWTKAAAAVTAHLQHIHLARNRSKALDQQPLDKVTAPRASKWAVLVVSVVIVVIQLFSELTVRWRTNGRHWTWVHFHPNANRLPPLGGCCKQNTK